MEHYNVIIIGGGVVGSAVARELSRYQLKIGVLEKELDVCTQTSGRNTGMLHAGFTYPLGSLRAECSVEGNLEFDDVAKELDVPFMRTGKLVVGFTDDDRERILRFKENGEKNGVPGLVMIDRERMDELDPSAGGNFAMHAPTSGILDPFTYTVALAENAHANGVDFLFDHEVISISKENDNHIIHATNGNYTCDWVVNSAGLNSALVSDMLGIFGYVIGGFKGEYYVLDKRAGENSKIPIYPAPTESGGFATHATPTIDGNVLVGPNSLWTDDMEDYSATVGSMEELVTDGKKMFKYMAPEYYIRNFAGIRPKRIDPVTKKPLDFVIEAREDFPKTVNLVGIESPGITSALPIARRVVSFIKAKENLQENKAFNPHRKGILRFSAQNEEKQRQLIDHNPDYGEIICRCEKVTRAEILEAIHNPLGVTTLNGLKYRTRAMMGRCQGGYCETRIVEMVEQELNKKPNEVYLSKQGSNVLIGRMRG